jgi:SAM-dependent methyltransferase
VPAEYDSFFDDYVLFRSTQDNANDLIEYPTFAEILSRLSFRLACDVACGTGTYVPVLATRAERVVACDLSPRAIAFCKKKYASHTNVTYACCDYRELHNHWGGFDLLTASLPVFDELRSFLDHAHTLLAPGGELVFSHFHPIYGAGKGSIDEDGIRISDYWGRRDRVAVNPFGNAIHAGSYSVAWKYYTIEEHIRLLREVGFTVLDLREPAIVDTPGRLGRRARMFPILVVIHARKTN